MLKLQFEKSQLVKRPKWIQELRHLSFQNFQAQGLPTVREESWKYTNVKPIDKKEFILAKAHDDFSPLKLKEALPAIHVFVVNGHFHSMFNTDIEGLNIKSLHSAMMEKAEGIQKLNKLAKNIDHGFAQLNSAFLHDGLYIHLEKNTQIQKPIHIYYVNTLSESAQYSRNLFLFDAFSEATVIEHFISEESEAYHSNHISEIHVASEAKISHIKLQQEADSAYHIGTTEVKQKKNSRFQSFVLSFGAKLSRSDTNIYLTEPGCECAQYGLYLGNQRQHFDHHTFVGHETPECCSRQLYKGILDESARAVFNGKVYVHEHAVKTDSQQMNKNLLLSDKAEVDTKPELEIYNDDVKCAHGATIGRLDDDQLFYLLSRGLKKSTAESLLRYAFSCEIIHFIKDKHLKAFLQNALLKKLPDSDEVRELIR